MQLLFRHKLLIAGATAVAAASAGGAYAATQSGKDPQQAFINDVAKHLNVSPAQLTTAVKAALIDRINAAVKAGQLTQAQANRLKQRIEQSSRLPFFFGAPVERFGAPRLFAFRAGGPLRAAAGYLGLTGEQLMGDLEAGKSLAQVATSRGKSVSGLEQAILAAETNRLNQLRSAGFITQAQEQRLLSRLSARIDRLVNRTGFAPRAQRLAPYGGPPPVAAPVMPPPYPGGDGPPPPAA